MKPRIHTLIRTVLVDEHRSAPETLGPAGQEATGVRGIQGVARQVAWDSQATTTDGQSISKSNARTESESIGLSVQEGISKRGWLFSRITRSDGQSRTRQKSIGTTVTHGTEQSITETAYVLTLNFVLEVTWSDGSVYPWPVRVLESGTNLAKARLKKNSLRDGEKVQLYVLHYRDGVLEPSAIHNLTTGAVVYRAAAEGGPAFLPARQFGTLPDIQALQRDELVGPVPLLDEMPLIRLDVERLRLVQVLGVRNFWEEAEVGPAALRQAAVSALAGLHTGGEPALYAIVGRPDGIAVYTGLGPIEPPPAPPPAPPLLLPLVTPEPPEPLPPLPMARRRSMLLLIPAATVGALGLAVVGNLVSLDASVTALGFGGLTGLGLFALGRGLRQPVAPLVAEPSAGVAMAEGEHLPETVETAVVPMIEPPIVPTPKDPPVVVRETLLAATLSAVYPDIELASQTAGDVVRLREALAAMPFGGLIVGTPATHQPINNSTVWPLEHLVRGLRGQGSWALVTIALPASDAEAQAMRSAALRERQELADAVQARESFGATAQRYGELLEAYTRKLERGQQGLWHVGVAFLAADETTYRILAGRLMAFGGPDALPDPLRVIPLSDGVPSIARLELVASYGPTAGHVRYPYRWMSLLETGELAAWIRLPAEEAPGYSVKGYAEFGRDTGQRGAGDAVRSLGRIKG